MNARKGERFLPGLKAGASALRSGELCQWASKAWWERELGCGIRGTLATWADCGFPTIAAKDDKYAAASTDASALMQGDLHAPGDAAVFMIPSGLLDADIIVLAHVDNTP